MYCKCIEFILVLLVDFWLYRVLVRMQLLLLDSLLLKELIMPLFLRVKTQLSCLTFTFTTRRFYTDLFLSADLDQYDYFLLAYSMILKLRLSRRMEIHFLRQRPFPLKMGI